MALVGGVGGCADGDPRRRMSLHEAVELSFYDIALATHRTRRDGQHRVVRLAAAAHRHRSDCRHTRNPPAEFQRPNPHTLDGTQHGDDVWRLWMRAVPFTPSKQPWTDGPAPRMRRSSIVRRAGSIV